MVRFKVWHNGDGDKPALCLEYRIRFSEPVDQQGEVMRIVRQSVADAFTQIMGVECFCATASEH